MSVSQGGGWHCGCWAATIRIGSEVEGPFRSLNSSSAPTMPLGDVLSLGRKLVQHWEYLNGCASSEAHLGPLAFRIMADAISRVMSLYEKAVDDVLKRKPSETRGTAELGTRQGVDGGATRNIPYHDETPSHSATSISIGELELDDEEEVAIVSREALRHSIIRLGAMLQDLEEETYRHNPDEASNAVQCPLQDKEIKELIGWSFRLLGKVSKPI
ncbi:uncharacterized protein F4822DRAFT_198197 [Hypoxylon trugodes]|uniref:uncharacterized protein n=1 Tax=Hypoxylon trugodes TaxID=326681 RepID=UPI002197467E|nr:uncharacterized protein F4822DRAFT_198197 [Hypoxylon trugodes]KAI1389349.1 hypothetical protein F4822DRAFT_198197 [Hypoxylon trugodes]